MKPRQVLLIAGLGILGLWHAAMDVDAADPSRGRQILLNRGLQIQSLVFFCTEPGFSNLDQWARANFTGINFWQARRTALGQLPPGTTWGREYIYEKPSEKNLTSDELPYADDLLTLQYYDEPVDILEPARLKDMAATYASWRSLYPGVLAYTGSCGWGNPIDVAALRVYMRATKPDMLMFNGYPSFSFCEAGNSGRCKWYSFMQRYRTVALEGYDGTGRQPIPYAQFLNLFRPAGSGGMPGESYVRLQQNASWAFGFSMVSAFVYNSVNAEVTSVMFASDGDVDPTPVFGYVAETNRQSRNLGPALVRLVSTDIRMIPGTTRSPNGKGYADAPLPPNISVWAPGAGGDRHITGIVPRGKPGASDSHVHADVLIGHFKPLLVDNRDCTFVEGPSFMIVNGAATGTAAQSTEQYHITFDFAGSRFNSLARLSRDTGKVERVALTPTGGSTYALDLTLEGGTGDLFRFCSP